MQFRQTFSRTAANMQKMGAYYTDLEHCIDISKMFVWPEDEVCVLEPSIGDGSAVKAVTRAAENENVKIYGVELNAAVAKETGDDTAMEEILHADFLEDFRCSNQVFSFVFGNPPYMDDEDCGEKIRVERRFLEKVTNYITRDGILVWVIPYRVFMEDAYLSSWMGRYQTLALYKFREPEFSRFKQIVVVGRRTKTNGCVTKDDRKAMKERFATIEDVPELPKYPTETIMVTPSYKKDIKEFCARAFDADKAYEFLKTNPFGDVKEIINKRITMPQVKEGFDEKPPIPLKKDSLYLVATCGGGAGLTGTDGVDLHLQRGHAEIVEDIEVETDQKTGQTRQLVRTRTEITMSVLENSGKLTHLV